MKVARTVWSGGKARDNLKGLPIAIFNLKPTKNRTYFFLSKEDACKLSNILADNEITGWGLYPLDEIRDCIPSTIKIPEYLTETDAMFEIKATEREPQVFVSKFDPLEMEELIEEYFDDPKTKRVQSMIHEIRNKKHQRGEIF